MFSLVAAAASLYLQGEVQPDWVRKDHELRIAGQSIRYQTTAGMMPIRSKTGDIDGRIFFSYYKRTNGASTAKRPLMFIFNGGPGSASVWLHMGFAGPKRPKLGTKEGFMPPPPYELVTNDESLLPESDLVMIDPVGTGFSRPNKPEDGAKFWGVDVDIASVGEFIRSFLSTENRWLSPIYVMGESYGGIRGSGLSIWLHGKGIGLNGLILISPLIGPSVVSETVKAGDADVQSYIPTFAASAWYHHKLSPDMQKKTIGEVYNEALTFARGEYLTAIGQGDKLPADKRKEILVKLQTFTGLSEELLEKVNLKPQSFRWFKELLRSDKQLIGRYDARYVIPDLNPSTNRGGPDPSYTQVQPPFTSTINDYITSDLGYQTTLKYYILGEGINGPWKYPDGQLDKSDSIRQALQANPYTKVMVAMGYYDAACPMGANDQLLDRLEMDDRLKANIVRTRYETGHMIYVDDSARKKLHADVASFIKSQSNPTAPNNIFKRN